jgi:hypothetical protein
MSSICNLSDVVIVRPLVEYRPSIAERVVGLFPSDRVLRRIFLDTVLHSCLAFSGFFGMGLVVSRIAMIDNNDKINGKGVDPVIELVAVFSCFILWMLGTYMAFSLNGYYKEIKNMRQDVTQGDRLFGRTLNIVVGIVQRIYQATECLTINQPCRNLPSLDESLFDTPLSNMIKDEKIKEEIFHDLIDMDTSVSVNVALLEEVVRMRSL